MVNSLNMRFSIFTIVFSLLLVACGRKLVPHGVSHPYTFTKEALGKRGMVVSAHPLASQVGLNILKQGGNAIDAAVAVQMMLAVVYPQAGNLGGGGFLIYRSADGKSVAALDYREKAPAAAHRDMYLDTQGNVVPELSQKGRLAAGVPGSVAGMWESHQKYGKLPWGKLLDDAIRVAENGFPITKQEADNLNKERDNFLKYNYIRPEQFLKDSAWRPGDLLIQKELAYTLQHVRDKGQAGFYSGEIAGRIATDALRGNGIITLSDLANYRAIWRTPIEFDYKDCHIISMPPPSSGGILLAQMLGMIEPYPIAQMGFHSTDAVHLMVEVERRAFADRAQHLGDSDFWKVPLRAMTSTGYLRERMSTFSEQQATKSSETLPGDFTSEQTTHLSIVDGEGNAVSVTTTLNDSYGSRAVVAGAGFILNNEMDDFSAKPGIPNLYGLIGSEANAIAPNKRMLSSMTPTIVERKGKLWLVVGTPGGSTIPTTVFQTILNIREFGQPLKEAVHGLRFHHQHTPDQIFIEKDALSRETISALRQRGHTVQERGPIGRVEAILVEQDGSLRGVADMRGDDCAAGW